MTTRSDLGQAIALLQLEYSTMPPVTGARLEMWWKAMQAFPDGAVTAAAEQHIKTNHFPPQLADIVKLCSAQIDGQWLGADEAWALMPKSEHDSAMLTNEIAQAMASASSLLEMGDKVAARMAFKDAYNRLVEQAKIAGRAPRYFPSFGGDKLGHAAVLSQAVLRGQIPLQQALEYKPELATEILGMADVESHPLLAAPSEKGKAVVKALLADLRAIK